MFIESIKKRFDFLRRLRPTAIICIILALSVLLLGVIVGLAWLLAPESEEDYGYYTGGLNFGEMSAVIYELTSDETIGAVYLKSQSMGNFDGSKWDESIPEYDKLVSSQYAASYLTSIALQNSGAKEYKLNIKPYTTTYVVPYYAATRNSTVQKSDIKNEGLTTSEYSVYMYKYESSDGVSHTERHSSYESKYSEFVYENYLEVDSTTKKFLNNVIKENNFSADDSDIISKVTTYVRGLARYDLLYDTALDKEENSVISFMSGEYESGVCRHFASSATLLYRALGIPARYTTGYLTTVVAGATTSVTALNAHAWVEVYINGIGWIQVEPTPPMSLPDSPDIPENPIDGLTLFKVQSDSNASLLLKSKSYCDYEGNGWNENYSYLDRLSGGYSAQYLTSKAIEESGQVATKSIEITPMSDAYVLPYYVSTFGNDTHTVQTSDTHVSGNADKTYTVNYYNYPSTDVSVTYPLTVSYESRYSEFVYENYLNNSRLDVSDVKYLEAIIEEQGFDATDSEVITKVCNYLQNSCNYKLKYDTALDESDNYAIEFLTKYKEGSSKHFAAAATLIFRELGIPARFTEGFSVKALAGKVTAVTSTNAYYWVEVYKNGCGWVAVDVMSKYDEGSVDGPDDEKVDVFEIFADSNDTVYLKEESFGDYNGQGFDYMGNDYYEYFNDYSAAFIPSLIAQFNGGVKIHTLEINPLNSKYDVRYMLPYYATTYDSIYQSSDVRVEGPENQYYTVSYYKFNYQSSISDYSLIEYESRYADFVRNNYLNVDSETYDYMRYIAKLNKLDAGSSTIIEDVARYIQRAAKYDLKYDTSLDSQPNVAIAFLSKYKTGVCRHYAMAATLLYRSLGIPARYTTGYAVDTKANQWVTVTNMDAHAWVEVYIDGFGWKMVEVTGSDEEVPVTAVELTLDNINKQYDGTPMYYYGSYTGFEAYENMGYRLEIEFSGERTDPGKTYADIGNFRVYNEYGEDVSESFKFTRKLGSGCIQIWIDTLYIKSNNVNMVYDGYEYSGDINGYTINGYDYNQYKLNNQYINDTGEYHDFVITSTVSSTDVCKVSNKYDVKIYSNGEDITSYYKIIKSTGTFEIERRAITIKAGSIDVSYLDYFGEEFTYNEIEYDPLLLADGDYIAAWSVTGSISDPGSVDNILDPNSIIILNSQGDDVTANYNITTQKGKINMEL